MKKLDRNELLSLEQYALERDKFRENAIRHKQLRRVEIGPHASIFFEDRTTIQYQVQEVLRIEKIFEADGIEEELEAYNPLIPDGSNWKATMMIEFRDADERRVALTQLINIEDLTWVKTTNHDKVMAIADEDLERETDDKTSAVHFLRFELPQEFVASVKNGDAISMGIDHDNYNYAVDPIQEQTRVSLVADLD